MSFRRFLLSQNQKHLKVALNSCSKCNFTSNFESALTMHRQLHHDEAAGPLHDAEDLHKNTADLSPKKKRELSPTSIYSRKSNLVKLGSRASATRILGKLRAKICRSKMLTSHAEDPLNIMLNADLSCRSDCTSKALQLESASRVSAVSQVRESARETYACHLCSFDADRITALDRHLLNDHKIGLENLLKLVLAKTKDGLLEDSPPDIFGARQPYYNPVVSDNDFPDILDDGEFVVESNTPKIRIVKHSAVNTDLTWKDIPDLTNNCRMITKEIDRLIKHPARLEKNDLLEKMQTLNDYMCKFVDSSNTLKKVLSRETDGRYTGRKEALGTDEQYFHLRLGGHNTPRSSQDWERAHSDKLERYKSKHSAKFRSDKSKLSAESYYF